jgi:HSP20 family molecular chaperone IbpA
VVELKMSILPLFFDLVDDPLEEAFGIRAQPSNFGLGLYPHELRTPTSLIPSRRAPLQRFELYPRSWQRKRRSGNKESSLATVSSSKDGFQVCLDVEHFAPNEITVKTVDNTITVEGQHNEKEDEHGHIYRHFVRKYSLPKGYDIKDVVSTLSSDGILTIKAPPPQSSAESNERIIQIQQTGPAHLSVKQNTDAKPDGKLEEKMTE